jgi:mono/diheme cytochrome c family protein
MTHPRPNTALAVPVLLALVGAGLAGCRGDRFDAPPRQFFPDMDDSPKWKPQTATDFFPDRRAMRPFVPGTVPFARGVSASPDERAAFLREDAAFFEGRDANGYLWKIPPQVEVNIGLIRRGEERYNIFCAACHGYYGDGRGEVGKVWSYALPNFHDDRYKPNPADPTATENQRRDGYIFHVIRHGVPGATDGGLKMPGYANAIGERDAWAIVAYIRALQATREGTRDDLPPELRSRYDANQRARSTPAPAPSTTPAENSR